MSDNNGCSYGTARSYNFPDSLNSSAYVNIYGTSYNMCTGSDLWARYTIQGVAEYEEDIDSIKWIGPNDFYLNHPYLGDSRLFLEDLQPEDAGTYFVEVFLGPYTVSDSMEVNISPNEASVLSTELIPRASCDSPTGGSFTIEVDGSGPFRSYVWGSGNDYVNAEESPIVHSNLSEHYGGRLVEIRTGYADYCYTHTRIPEFPHPVSASFNIMAADCQNQNGVVSVVVDPPAERVRWYIDGQNSYVDTTFTAENVPVGWHSVRIENAAGCNFHSVPFYMPSAVAFEIQMNAQPSCENASGELEVSVQEPSSGGFDVMWNNGTSGLVNSNLATGWYSVTVTDERPGSF